MTTEIKVDDSAIERHFCVPMEQLKRHPMDDESAELLIRLMLSGVKTGVLTEEDKPQIVKLIEKRIAAAHTFRIVDERLLLFMLCFAPTPGLAVMYIWYMQYWCHKNGRKEIDLEVFCQQIFPHGFPSESDMSKLWYDIKISNNGTTVNLLDVFGAGTSILD